MPQEEPSPRFGLQVCRPFLALIRSLGGGTDRGCRCLSVGTALSGQAGAGAGGPDPRPPPRLLLLFTNEGRNEDVSSPICR